MKKSLFIVAVVLLVICGMAFTCSAAALAPEVVDNMNDIVVVSGTAEPGTSVTLTVLNPVDTEDEGTPFNPVSTDRGIQYFDSALAMSTYNCPHPNKPENYVNFCFHFQIEGASGEFTFITNADGVKSSQPFSFFPALVKQEIIEEINDADEIDADLTLRALTNFSLKDDPLCSGTSITAIADAIEALKENHGGSFPFETADDLNSMAVILKHACLIAAYNTDNDNVLTSGGSLLYLEDVLNLSDTPEIDDYEENLSDKALVVNDMFDGEYTNIEEIEEAFKESVRFRVLVDYRDRGFGHVEYYFDRYEEYYEEIGFDFDDFGRVRKKDSIYSDVAFSTADNIVKLKNEFNRLVDKALNPDDGKSSGGSGSGGYVPDKTDEVVVTPVNPVVPPVATVGGFSDVPVTHWAAEPIKALVEEGILSGRGNGNFDTNGTITRAELIKIAVLSTMDKVDDTASNPFADADSHWAKAHIATAVKAGITTGVNDKEFNPDGLITREQAATILYRAVKAKGVELKTTDEKFADDALISEWASEGVYALKASGVISGKGDNNFCPKDNLTRAEAAKLVYTIKNLK